MRVVWATAVLTTILLCAPPAVLAESGFYEVPGNPNNLPTWTFRSYKLDSGRGPNIKDHHRVLVSCRLKGRPVADGNVWYYRIAEKPWSGRYYASADDFYNDGRSTGSLKGTPYFDPRVPVC